MKKGDIVLVNVPYTDLSDRKLRPALILGVVQEDLLCCFISSKIEACSYYDVLVKKDLKNNLKVDSVLRASKLFTIHHSLVEWKIGSLSKRIYREVTKKVIDLIV